MDVVGLGYCVYDMLARVPYIPDFDDVRMTHVNDLVTDGGGPVCTALTALARLGAHTGYIGILGDEREGHWLRERLSAEGIDVARLRVTATGGTNICFILVDKTTARRAIICHPRVESCELVLTDADRTYVRSARVLHLDGQFMPAAIQAARWAQDTGVRVCYDGNHPRPGLEHLLSLVDWLVVSEAFPEAWTGSKDLQRAASQLLGYGVDVLVVTQGARGCEVWTSDIHFQVAGYPVPAVDTTGAGDAFHGAFIYGMLQEWEWNRVASFANAVGALNCLTLGGQRGLPSLQEVQAFIEDRHRTMAGIT
jgi:ribokinase